MRAGQPVLTAEDRQALGKLNRLALEHMRRETDAGRAVTLRELADEIGCGEAGASARLRDLRNKYGYRVEKRRSSGPNGITTRTYLYQVFPPAGPRQQRLPLPPLHFEPGQKNFV